MPTYEYKCDNRHVFEVIQSMSDDALTKCEECGAPAQRVLFAPAVHFKGKGFYNTDYGTKKRAREKAKSQSSDTPSTSSSDTGTKSSDSKSSAKDSPKSSSSAKPKKD
jgi:putative FmdB family regulatory protein